MRTWKLSLMDFSLSSDWPLHSKLLLAGSPQQLTDDDIYSDIISGHVSFSLNIRSLNHIWSNQLLLSHWLSARSICADRFEQIDVSETRVKKQVCLFVYGPRSQTEAKEESRQDREWGWMRRYTVGGGDGGEGTGVQAGEGGQLIGMMGVYCRTGSETTWEVLQSRRDSSLNIH